MVVTLLVYVTEAPRLKHKINWGKYTCSSCIFLRDHSVFHHSTGRYQEKRQTVLFSFFLLLQGWIATVCPFSYGFTCVSNPGLPVCLFFFNPNPNTRKAILSRRGTPWHSPCSSHSFHYFSGALPLVLSGKSHWPVERLSKEWTFSDCCPGNASPVPAFPLHSPMLLLTWV